MSTESIFFSYSRADSEVVLQLAKELRAGGASIWLDQLDIKPGVRWDSEIEKALEESNTLLVVLSKTSVDSQNVMDEVSYALEEGKKVVPVLLEECEIPFRLRRFQYADFCADHDKGMKALVEALGLEQTVASKLTSTKTAAKAVGTPKAAPKVEKAAPVSVQKEADTALKSKLPMFIVGGLVGLFAILYFTGVFSSGDELNDGITDNATPNNESQFTSDNSSADNADYASSLLAKGISNFTVQSDKDLTDLVDYIGENGKNNSNTYQSACKDIFRYFNKEAIVTYSDPNGDVYFDKVIYHKNGKLTYADDNGLPPEVGDLLYCYTKTDVFDVGTQQYMEGQAIDVGEMVYVTQLSKTEDNYLFIYIRYADF